MHDAFDLSSTPVVASITERVESLLLHGSKLYVGCQNGSLHVYNLKDASAEGQLPEATLEKVVKGFAKKSIEQLGVVKECNSLVSLSDGTIYLHDLHTLQKQTVLGTSSAATKGQAGIFALETSVQTGNPFANASSKNNEKASTTQSPASKVGAGRRSAGKGKEPETNEPTDAPVVVTTLAVGCRRRLVIFWWRDSQWQDPKEVSLPHQIRSLAFPLAHSLFLGFSTSEYGVVSLPFVTNPNSKTALAVNEPFTPAATPPPVASTSGTSGSTAAAGTSHLGAIPGLGSLGGLAVKTGGYMGLGGKVDRNLVSKVRDGEVVVQRDNSGVFLDATGNPSRSNSIEYSYQPEEMATCWPYLISILPAPAAVGSLTKQQSYDPLNALPTLHIHTLPTLSPTQILHVPPLSIRTETRPVSIIDLPPIPVTQTARLLTTGPKGKAPMAILTHPLSESGSKGSITPPTSIYLIAHLPWQKQIDSLIALGQYEDALSLVSSLDAADHHLSDAKETFKRLRILAGLSMFVNKKQYDKAIDIFIEENVNPAKVVALFPKAISGKLYCDREDIEEAWGGRSRENYITQDSERRQGAEDSKPRQQTTVDSTTSEAGDEHKAWRFSPAGKKKPEEDTASVKSKRSYLTTLKDAAREVTGSSDSARDPPKQAEDLSYKLSVDVLMRYLPDRRQQFLRALSSLPPRSRPTPSSPLPEKPSNSQEDLFAFPDAPLTEYKPEQLQRVAQVVETALFKCYLHAKPGLLGPLCRIENWCEVEEVEELLLEAHKYRELLDLYNGKQMHEKAIQLLQRMANEQENGDTEDRVLPTIQYLQKLGSKHLDLIFSASTWVFSKAPALGIQVFTADLEEVESLPRHAVSLFLDKNAPSKEIYIEYLEHIVFSLREDGPEFHERLAELYLDAVEGETKTKVDAGEQSKAYKKLLDFLESSQQYRADRLLGRIPDGKMYEARAILLGKLGQHDGALQIYVYRLEDHARAEEYCKRVYDSSDPARASIFLTLLKVYLRPRKEDLSSMKGGHALFGPALSLLSSQATRMDPNEVLDLLPPLMTIQELRTFLSKSMRRRIDEKHFRKVEVGVWRARTDQIERTLVDLEGRKVKVTDGRLCPQCHKRLGTSVIAVHSPAGIVTHYQCTERWRESQQGTAFSE